MRKNLIYGATEAIFGMSLFFILILYIVFSPDVPMINAFWLLVPFFVFVHGLYRLDKLDAYLRREQRDDPAFWSHHNFR